jgi:hypothetical protein
VEVSIQLLDRDGNVWRDDQGKDVPLAYDWFGYNWTGGNKVWTESVAREDQPGDAQFQIELSLIETYVLRGEAGAVSSGNFTVSTSWE